MTAKYVRDKMRAWADAITEAKFYDTINQDQNPSDAVWFTMEFFALEHTGKTFCGLDYTETGSIDLVFCARPGAGDGEILTALEPAVTAFVANHDPAGKLQIESFEPVEEYSSGTADSFYRLVVGINYSFAA